MKKLTTLLIIILFLGCSTQKNKNLNKRYHSTVSTYNVLFNGNESINEGKESFLKSYKEDFWEILPVEPIESTNKIITVDGLENKSFLKAEEKAAKAIQKHSMLIGGVQYNPKTQYAYLMLGRARYLDQRYVQAIDAFNQVYKLNIENEVWKRSVIWKARSNIRLEQELVAVELLQELLKNKKNSSEIVAKAYSVLSMAYLKLNKTNEALKALEIAQRNAKDKNHKARLLYIKGQLYEKQNEIDSAKNSFNKILNFKRKISRNIYINAKVKALLYSESLNSKKEFLKLIKNEENKPYLDKIYYNYSKLLFSNGSVAMAKNFLNMSIKENPADKKLKSKAYIKFSELNFNDTNFLTAGRYLDSTLQVLDKKSKEFWFYERQKKGIQKVVDLEENLIFYDSLIRLSSYDKKKLDEILKLISTENQQQSEKSSSNEVRQDRVFKKTNFYFYNDKIVAFGIKSFKSVWGNRERNTYWRSEKSILKNNISSDNTANEEGSNKLVSENETQFLELYKDIPFSELKKDSLNNLIDLSKLELAELYTLKYKNYRLGETVLTQYLSKDPNSNRANKAKYLLYKLYKIQNNEKYIKIKEDIIASDSLSRFAKILLKDPDMLMDENKSLALRDSLAKMFNNQDFEKIIKSVDLNIDIVEKEEIKVDLELLRAQSYGRLEGIEKYTELLKEISKKYSENKTAIDLNKTISMIGRKWKTPISLKASKDFKLIFIVNNSDLNKSEILKINSKISTELNSINRVSFDVYNYKNNLIVIHDFKSEEKAEDTALKITVQIPELRLKNNFVALSSQYKNMLIYKTLDLD
ncbi:tetratricopeptide repeat protein [Flavobacteriaceae bacterium]|nr:tetratricopeptide repeat protein [Flavobacteriaceae bacterium]